jgi:hypothetical protein
MKVKGSPIKVGDPFFNQTQAPGYFLSGSSIFTGILPERTARMKRS